MCVYGASLQGGLTFYFPKEIEYCEDSIFRTTVVWGYGTFEGLVTQTPAAALVELGDLLIL